MSSQHQSTSKTYDVLVWAWHRVRHSPYPGSSWALAILLQFLCSPRGREQGGLRAY